MHSLDSGKKKFNENVTRIRKRVSKNDLSTFELNIPGGFRFLRVDYNRESNIFLICANLNYLWWIPKRITLEEY